MKARKRFAQHFLERAWVDKLISRLDPRAGEEFIEIGPGRGALTRPLAAAGAHVRAIEIDRDLAADLTAQALPNVTVITADVLDLPATEILPPARPAPASPAPAGPAPAGSPSGGSAPGGPASGGSAPGGADVGGRAQPPALAPSPSSLTPSGGAPGVATSAELRVVPPRGDAERVRVVGNLPYNISSPILFRLLALARESPRIQDATLMLQREVADRVAAGPGSGDYGPLGILTALHADVDRLLALPPGAFRPPPKVHSAVIRLRFRPSPVDVHDYLRFERLVRTIFQQRRKMLANALAPVLAGPAAPLLARADLDGRRRPETLTLAELARLAACLDDERPAG